MSLHNLQEMKGIVDTLVGLCLGCLEEQGFVQKEQVQNNWYTRCDLDGRLGKAGLAAGASIDDRGMPVMVYRSRSSVQAIIYVIFHESVHLAQICKGDLLPGKGFFIWKGVKIKNLAHDDPNYFAKEHQPWECEAQDWEKKLRSTIFNKHPELEQLITNGSTGCS